MTVVVGCRFAEGLILTADSRATWTGPTALVEDRLQKLLPVTPAVALAYAGDARAAERVWAAMRKRISRRPRRGHTPIVLADIPRIARHEYRRHCQQIGRPLPLDLVIAYVAGGGATRLARFSAPDFQTTNLGADLIVVGSGASIAPAIQDARSRIDSSRTTLREKGQTLLMAVEEQLRRQQPLGVGGLFQTVMVEPSGIRPLAYGYMDLDPEGPPESLSMTINRGSWIQRDEGNRVSVELQMPRAMRAPAADVRVVDYAPAPAPTPPRFYLSYFILCRNLQDSPGNVTFEQPIAQVSTDRYPRSIGAMAAGALWGQAGTHRTRIDLVDGFGKRVTLHEGTLRIEFFPEETGFSVQIVLPHIAPGHWFVEWLVNEQLIARRALYFRPISRAEVAFYGLRHLGAVQESISAAEHAALQDPVVEQSGRPALEYFVVGEGVTREPGRLVFRNRFQAVYWNRYPLLLRATVALSARLPRGTHSVTVELREARSHDSAVVVTGTLAVLSSAVCEPIEGATVIRIPTPGIYFINARIADELIASSILFADTDRPQYGYGQEDALLAEVRAGQLQILLRRSRQG